MVGQRCEALGQLQRRRQRIDPADDNDRQPNSASAKTLPSSTALARSFEGIDARPAPISGSSSCRQSSRRQAGLLVPEDFAQPVHQRITTKGRHHRHHQVARLFEQVFQRPQVGAGPVHQLLGGAALAAQQQAVLDVLQSIRNRGQQAPGQAVGDDQRPVVMDRLALPRLTDGVVDEMLLQPAQVAGKGRRRLDEQRLRQLVQPEALHGDGVQQLVVAQPGRRRFRPLAGEDQPRRGDQELPDPPGGMQTEMDQAPASSSPGRWRRTSARPGTAWRRSAPT
jgi:hypothetical protein